MTTDRTPASVAVRLGRRLSQGPNGCIEWVGARNESGYGRIGADIPGEPRMMYAHRLAFYLVALDGGTFR